VAMKTKPLLAFTILPCCFVVNFVAGGRLCAPKRLGGLKSGLNNCQSLASHAGRVADSHDAAAPNDQNKTAAIGKKSNGIWHIYGACSEPRCHWVAMENCYGTISRPKNHMSRSSAGIPI
jgi:hypothetical protein